MADEGGGRESELAVGAPDEDARTRRGVLALVGGAAAAIAAMVAVPVIPFFAGPVLRAKANETWVPVGPADQFSEERREITYEFSKRDGWYTARQLRRVVVGKQPEGFIVLSTECTHAGCGVEWQPDQQRFFCPCHQGIFNADGTVQGGPPPRPLDRLEARVRDGVLEVKET
jgi:menaquinol-cytochrome c reductase iron-sulfur subunit